MQNTVAGVSEIELTHVNGVSEPLTVATIPQADYTAATITYSDVGVGFIYQDDLHFNLSIVQTNPIVATADVASPINIDGTGTALTLDTLLASPLVLGTTSLGNPTYIATPAFALTSFKPVAEPTNDRNGKANLRGLVNSVGSGTFNMNNSTTDSFNIETSPATVFQGITSLSQLPPNAPASVDVALQADGSFRATRIEVENTATVGSWVGPFVATYQAGAYSEIIPILWQQSNPAFPNLVSDVYPWTFQFTPSTNFQRSGSAIDLNDLPFTPSFASFADVALGQGLSIDWTTEQFLASQPLTMAITASLVPRTFSATITQIAPTTGYTVYSLTLAPNDSMQIIRGTTSLTAYTNAGTQLEDGPLAVGEQIRAKSK